MNPTNSNNSQNDNSFNDNKKNNSNENSENKVDIQQLINNKPSIFKRKAKKKVEPKINKGNNEEDELKKISKEIGGNVTGIIKQDELEHSVVNQFIYKSVQKQIEIEEKRLKRAIALSNATSRKIDTNFRKWMNPKTSEREKTNLKRIIDQLKSELKTHKKDIKEIQQRIDDNKKNYNTSLSYSNEPKKFLNRNNTNNNNYRASSSSASLPKIKKRRFSTQDNSDDDEITTHKFNINYKPRYKLKGPSKEISVSLPQLTEEMKLKHHYLYRNEEDKESVDLNQYNNDMNIEDDDDKIEIQANFKEIQEGSNLNSNDIVLNENIQVHTFNPNKRIRYDQFFDQSDTEENVNDTKNKSESKDDAEFQPNSEENESNSSESEYIDVDTSSDYTPHIVLNEQTNKKKSRRKQNRSLYSTQHIDDGDEFYYQGRLAKWVKKRRLRRLNANSEKLITETDIDEEELIKDMEQEMYMLDVGDTEVSLGNGYKIPNEVYDKLFLYQKTCIQWLWELHQQDVGGIIGDEMGLGKTIQTISYIYGLTYSGLLKQPAIVVCPATLMKQWVEEFHEWAPPLRVVILHSTGSGMPQLNALSDNTLMADLDSETEMILNDNFSEIEESSESSDDDDDDVEDFHYAKWKLQHRKNKKKRKRHIRSRQSKKNLLKFKRLVDRVKSYGHVLITTYEGLRTYKPIILSTEWSYAFLDEGHKIRNPDSDITLLCKQLKTSHRILLSGTPIQNSLKELWSLFDFIYPGRLGTLPMFVKLFEIPIKMGGYANASNQEIKTSIRCATALRDTINPYLLRRLKVDVASDLPKKSEHVLFCMITEEQKQHYKSFIESHEANEIYNGKRNVLYGIDILRKICNHPDLLRRKQKEEIEDYGYYKKSGKMVVVNGLLKTWYESNNKVLLFCQTRQMMEILELFIQHKGYTYRKMDGDTPIKTRVFLVDEFNNNKDIFVFLLTTKVGGLGINLCSANRVIIFDPDWNPSTDMQARERAWRLGQKRDVAIFRIMAKGTVEEKIYHRQIYKQFLSNKILIDPNHQRFFKQDDLMDLFSYNDDSDEVNGKSLTGKILKNMNMDVEINKNDIAHMEEDIHEKEEQKEKEKKHENETEKENKNETSQNKNNQEFIVKLNNTESTGEIDSEITMNDSFSSNENSHQSNTSTATTSSNKTKDKKKKGLSYDSIDNNIKQMKYKGIKNKKHFEDDHTKQIRKEIDNIEGVEYTEEFKVKSKNEEEEESDDDDNDLFTQSEDESDSNPGKRRKSKKGKSQYKKDEDSIDVEDLEKEDTNEMEDKEYQSKDELRILKNLMKVTGAVSVIEHDKIMDSKKWSDIRDEKEAERIANNAVKKLRRFMERRRHVDISIPTWTGSSGLIGSNQPKKPIFGQKINPKIAKRNSELQQNNNSSNSIKALLNKKLQKHPEGEEASNHSITTPGLPNQLFGKGKMAGFNSIQTKEDIQANGLSSNTLIYLLQWKNAEIQQDNGNSGELTNEIGDSNKENLILQVRDFIMEHEEQRVTSKEIIDHFKMKTTKKDIELIRRMLKRICTFQKHPSEDGSSKGYWILKDEFKENLE
ncbi:SNF2 family N-terminal domain-containing protein [Neocallimastix sp. 'constans']|jgi:SNF2 family DNA or RNA helicase